MRLGSSILGGKPMRIPGVVDVYQVGDEWVARSWPKVQNQPNSAAQLLWRKRFKDAKAKISSFRGLYLEAWQAVPCPTGKMWIDIAMTSIMKLPGSFGNVAWPNDLRFVLSVPQSTRPWGWALHTRCPSNQAFANAMIWWLYGLQKLSKLETCLKWNNAGFICSKGKRPKIKWKPSIDATPEQNVTVYSTNFYLSWPPFLLISPCPDGLTIMKLHKNLGPPDTTIDWSLTMPPVKLTPEAWPGYPD